MKLIHGLYIWIKSAVLISILRLSHTINTALYNAATKTEKQHKDWNEKYNA